MSEGGEVKVKERIVFASGSLAKSALASTSGETQLYVWGIIKRK